MESKHDSRDHGRDYYERQGSYDRDYQRDRYGERGRHEDNRTASEVESKADKGPELTFAQKL